MPRRNDEAKKDYKVFSLINEARTDKSKSASVQESIKIGEDLKNYF